MSFDASLIAGNELIYIDLAAQNAANFIHEVWSETPASQFHCPKLYTVILEILVSY